MDHIPAAKAGILSLNVRSKLENILFCLIGMSVEKIIFFLFSFYKKLYFCSNRIIKYK